MEQGTSTTASFTGTLLRREHTLGERFVQLVFREENRDVLCVSTNPRAATLPIGQDYRVQGVFKQHGTREFIYDPKVALLKKHWRPIRRVMFVVIVVTCVAGLGSVGYMEQHSTTPKKSLPSTPAQHAVFDTPPSTPAAPTAATTPTSTPAPASAPAVVTTKQVSKSATKAAAAVTATLPSSSVSPSAPAVVPDVPADLSTPTDVAAVVTGDINNPDSITVTWGTSTDTGTAGLGGYYIFQNGNSTPIATVGTGTTSYVDESPVAGSGAAYSYTVEAYDATNTADVSAISAASPIVTAP